MVVVFHIMNNRTPLPFFIPRKRVANMLITHHGNRFVQSESYSMYLERYILIIYMHVYIYIYIPVTDTSAKNCTAPPEPLGDHVKTICNNVTPWPRNLFLSRNLFVSREELLYNINANEAGVLEIARWTLLGRCSRLRRAPARDHCSRPFYHGGTLTLRLHQRGKNVAVLEFGTSGK